MLENAVIGDAVNFKSALPRCGTSRERALVHCVHARYLIDTGQTESAAPSLNMQNHVSFESVMSVGAPVLGYT